MFTHIEPNILNAFRIAKSIMYNPDHYLWGYKV